MPFQVNENSNFYKKIAKQLHLNQELKLWYKRFYGLFCYSQHQMMIKMGWNILANHADWIIWGNRKEILHKSKTHTHWWCHSAALKAINLNMFLIRNNLILYIFFCSRFIRPTFFILATKKFSAWKFEVVKFSMRKLWFWC